MARVEIYRLASNPVTVEVEEPGTVRDVFSQPGTGEVMGYEGKTLMQVIEEEGLSSLGSIRVDGAPADLDTPVEAGSVILLVPEVEGGLR